MTGRIPVLALATLVAACQVEEEFVDAAGWTVEQQQVIDRFKSCWGETDNEKWLACYHEDYVGWYYDNPAPYTKDDKRAQAAGGEWDGYVYELVDFTAHKVHIEGDMAVTIYSGRSKSTNLSTGEDTIGPLMKWMDASVKVDGRWVSIADHGVQVTPEQSPVEQQGLLE